MPRTKPKSAQDAMLEALRAFGLAYPGAHTKSPWPGHLDLAVNGKTFTYLSVEGDPFSISCKLPQSFRAALRLPFTEPTGYGLAKSHWVTARFSERQTPPIELLKSWIDESYRAQAPKKLAARSLTRHIAPSDPAAPAARKKAGRKASKRPRASPSRAKRKMP